MSTKTEQARAAAHGKQAKGGKTLAEALGKPVRQTVETPAEKAARLALKKAEDAKLAKETAAALAKQKAAAKPAPKPAPKKTDYAKGQVVQGVAAAAQGATDGQPHTKLALARGEKREGFVKARDMAGNMVWVEEGFKWLLKDAKGNWLTFGNATMYAEIKRLVDAAVKAAPAKAAKAAAAPKPAPKAKADRAPRQAATKADRAYKRGPTPIAAKAGTWTRYMLELIAAHKSTDAAKAAHKASGQFASNPVDFNWAEKRGYIIWA